MEDIFGISELEVLRSIVSTLKAEGRYDLLLDAVGVPALQQLNILAAKATLSPLVITEDYRFLLPQYNKEVVMSPIHKAVYLLFLNHPEGIEFKRLSDHRDELYQLYKRMSNRIADNKINETIDRLVDPLDNAIHEKCARIKQVFSSLMDQYQASYYIISSHNIRHIDGTNHLWFERKKVIKLPRELVSML